MNKKNKNILVTTLLLMLSSVHAQTWDCISSELFQSRYKNAGLDPFMDGVPVETKLAVEYSEEANVLTINEDGVRPKIYDTTKPYVHLAVGKSDDGVHLITANRVMSSFLMIKKPESGDYLAINKSIEIEGSPASPVIREWTQIFNCISDRS